MLKKTAVVVSALCVAVVLLAFAPQQQQQQRSGPEVGKPAPLFTAVDTYGETHSLVDLRGKFVVLEWLNHDCPWVVKFYAQGHMQAWQKKFAEMDVVWYSVVSSAPGKQGHETNERHNELKEEKGAAPAAILVDEAGVVGRAYDARTTPHMYVIDPEGTLIYMGAMDDNRSNRSEDVEGARNHVVMALQEAMAGEPVSVPVTAPYGCTVKY